MTTETYAKLIRAVRDQSGMELSSIREAVTHGADAGWAGFSYYHDTCAFTETNREVIMEAVMQDAEEFGYDSIPEFMATWNKNYQCIDSTTFDNQLAWYALEAVGRMLDQRREDR